MQFECENKKNETKISMHSKFKFEFKFDAIEVMFVSYVWFLTTIEHVCLFNLKLECGFYEFSPFCICILECEYNCDWTITTSTATAYAHDNQEQKRTILGLIAPYRLEPINDIHVFPMEPIECAIPRKIKIPMHLFVFVQCD